MNICMDELTASRSAKKRCERSRAEQFAQLPLSFEELVVELGPSLLRVRRPADLARVAAGLGPRLSRRDYDRFVQLAADRFGCAFARRAGLPVGPPTLQLAG